MRRPRRFPPRPAAYLTAGGCAPARGAAPAAEHGRLGVTALPGGAFSLTLDGDGMDAPEAYCRLRDSCADAACAAVAEDEEALAEPLALPSEPQVRAPHPSPPAPGRA